MGGGGDAHEGQSVAEESKTGLLPRVSPKTLVPARVKARFLDGFDFGMRADVGFP